MLSTRSLSHASPATVGDLVVAILVTLVALPLLIASLAIIRPVKLRPKWYIPLLSFTTVALLIHLFISIATNAIGDPKAQKLRGSIDEEDLLDALGLSSSSKPSIGSYYATVAAGGAFFSIFECSVFAAMFLTLRHRLLSPIALAAAPSLVHTVKLVIDVGVVALFTILGIAAAALQQAANVSGATSYSNSMPDFLTQATVAKSLGDAAVAFYVLANIDVIATVIYVRSQLKQAYLLNDQISRTFLVVVVPLISLRTLYSIIARGVSNFTLLGLFVELEVALHLTDKLFIALPSLGIIAALLRWGTPSRVAAWNLRSNGGIPVPTNNALTYTTSASVTGSEVVDKGQNNA